LYVHIAIHTFVCQLHILAVARQKIYRQEQQQPRERFGCISATLANLYVFFIVLNYIECSVKTNKNQFKQLHFWRLIYLFINFSIINYWSFDRG